MTSNPGGIRSRLNAQWARIARSTRHASGSATAWRAAFTNFLIRRTARERLILLVGTIVIAAGLYWLLIWQPLSNARAAAVDRIAVLDRVIARARSIDPTTLSTSKASNDTPATIITNLASQFDITIRRIEPAGAQTSVILEDVKYETLIAWLDQLDQDDGLRSTIVEMDRRPEPGVVSAKLVIGN